MLTIAAIQNVLDVKRGFLRMDSQGEPRETPEPLDQIIVDALEELLAYKTAAAQAAQVVDEEGLRKMLGCLRMELPPEVWDDVSTRINAHLAALEAAPVYDAPQIPNVPTHIEGPGAVLRGEPGRYAWVRLGDIPATAPAGGEEAGG